MREKRIERDSERERMSFKRKKGERRVEDSERQRKNERKKEKRESPRKKITKPQNKTKHRTTKRKKSQENPRKPKERGERNPNTHTNTHSLLNASHRPGERRRETNMAAARVRFLLVVDYRTSRQFPAFPKGSSGTITSEWPRRDGSFPAKVTIQRFCLARDLLFR